MRLKKGWSTHIPVLLKYAQKTKGSILELGAGIHSTPLLHWICAEDGRKLITYESNSKWYKYAKQYQSRNHTIRFVKSWDSLDLEPPNTSAQKTNKRWSIVFVDHDIDRRFIDTVRLKDKADYIILHDTDTPAYKYDKVWDNFKYTFHWKFCRPHTSVVSNYYKL
ncbi:hypothetical protein ACFL25_01015 [Patescibacteria group bacterium]